jgi:outer membrane protein TolC
MSKAKISILLIVFFIFIIAGAYPEDKILTSEQKVLCFEDFLELAVSNDSEFEEILIDELTLKYQKALQLPAKDIVLSVKQQHEFFYSQDRNSPDTEVSLTKLFPYTGTKVSLGYETGASLTSDNLSSKATFLLSQPIAKNAFGHSTRLLDKIVGLEVDVARYQVVEAYEDYLALVLTAYYNWVEDYKNLAIGKKSYQSNLELLDDIYQRKEEKIAKSIDVNKVKLQVMSKEERLIELEEQYQKSLNIIKRIIRYKKDTPLVPASSEGIDSLAADFEALFEQFHENSRTFKILEKLENASGLKVARDANDLLPSINLLIGYEVGGNKYAMEDDDNFLYAGMQIDWPFGHQVQRAEYEIAKILERRAKLITTNTYYDLHTQLRNLYLQLEREKKLIKIIEQRIELAEAVLEAEAKNYSFGQVSLNDYIQAVNALDANRFNQVLHQALYQKLMVEWFRLTDQLVRYKDIESQIKKLDKK